MSAVLAESSCSSGRRRSCPTSKRVFAASTSTPSLSRTPARRRRMGSTAQSTRCSSSTGRSAPRASPSSSWTRYSASSSGRRNTHMAAQIDTAPGPGDTMERAGLESTLGVGIVGVSPVRGWAATAHIPALRALPNYEIRALSARSAESARAAGEVFGVSAVFADHEQLVTQPDIDLVAVTVKVPHHRQLVSAALPAGKAVYCERPLGLHLEHA